MTRFSEAKDFLRQHYDEFAPIAADRPLLDVLREDQDVLDPTITPERVEQSLEQLETKVYLSEKDPADYDPDAKRVLLTASEPLAANSLSLILEQLQTDRRARATGLLTDNVAAKTLSTRLEGFEQIHDPSKPMLYDALQTVAHDPFDVALVPVDPRNSPNAVSLFGAKSVFGAKKLYFMATGWVGVGGTDLFDAARRKTMDEIDGIFVADQLAADIVSYQLPDFPRNKILETGTPVVDAIETDRAEEYTNRGRSKLGLDDDTTAVLLMGHISPGSNSPESDLDPRISEKTFAQTFEAMVNLATRQPKRKFAILVRPHPRDPNAAELFDIAGQPGPANLRVVTATNDVVSMQEATYGADVTASIAGTDNFLAPRRGRQGIFLGYQEPGLGGPLLEKLYGPDIVGMINRADGLKVAKSPEEFAAAVADVQRTKEKKSDPKPVAGSSVDRILDVVLG